LSTSYNVEASNEFYRISDSTSAKLISIIGAEFGSTTVDNILFPTRGYNLSFQIEEANSLPYIISQTFGSEEYEGALFYKLVTNNSVFGSLGRKRNYIFAGKLKLGYMQTFYGDYDDIPLNRTFYAGGSNSIRAWESNELVPEDAPPLFDPITGEQEENFKGGTFLVEGSFEFRLRFMESLGTALFIDYGNTWLGYKAFRFDQIAVAVGTGLRYYTSIAPFRIDFGFKFYDAEDKQFIFRKNVWDNMEFHFGIGEAF
jgi:outer membrane protein insertion porin family